MLGLIQYRYSHVISFTMNLKEHKNTNGKYEKDYIIRSRPQNIKKIKAPRYFQNLEMCSFINKKMRTLPMSDDPVTKKHTNTHKQNELTNCKPYTEFTSIF